MSKFKAGQWVVRRGLPFLDAKPGGRYRIEEVRGGGLILRTLLGKQMQGTYDEEAFELDTSVPQPGEVKERGVVSPPVTKAKPKMLLSEDPQERKDTPITSGVLDYFPRALAAVAHCSKVGNDQHNPGQPLHWAKGKSTDHADCIARHLIDRHTVDTDGVSHMAKLAWRALALLESTLEAESAKQG